MIDSPPEFQLTCNCGIKISGTNENGVISLLKRHIESGVFHTGYMLRNKFEPGGTELEEIFSFLDPKFEKYGIPIHVESFV